MKNRQLDLLIYLLQKKKTTQGELAEIFEVSKKTIERDIDRLTLIGVPIFCQQGGGGGIYIDEKYKFGTSFFTPQEIAHMVAALHIAKSFTANPQNDEILKKLTLAEPNLTNMFKSDIQDHFSVDIYENPIDFESGIFAQINKCIDLKVLAKIDGKQTICLGYVYKPNGVHLFCLQDEYCLLEICKIESFNQTSTTFNGEYLTYEKYKITIKI